MLVLDFKFDEVLPGGQRPREEDDCLLDDGVGLSVGADPLLDPEGQPPDLLVLALLEVLLTELPGLLVVLDLVLQPDRLENALPFREPTSQLGQLGTGLVMLALDHQDLHPLQPDVLLIGL